MKFLSPEDGSETLEIMKGTRAQVTCMEGYTMEGDDGECDDGVWKKLTYLWLILCERRKLNNRDLSFTTQKEIACDSR